VHASFRGVSFIRQRIMRDEGAHINPRSILINFVNPGDGGGRSAATQIRLSIF